MSNSFIKKSYWIGYRFKRAKQRFVKSLLFFKYRDFIKTYHFSESIEDQDDQSLFPVWVCWWQGEENMPKIVQTCYKSLCAHANGHPVILITKDNYAEYLTLPEHILKKFDEGIITITHLSDILRVSLIYEYGGMWIDSTIFLTAPLSEKINCNAFSIKHYKSKPHITDYRWTAFFWYGKKKNILFHFVRSFFYEYWRKENKMINYLLIDYVFAIAYDAIPAIKEQIDTIPFNNPRHNDIRYQFKANAPFDPALYEEICSNTYLHKLSWKMNVKEYTEDGKLTFYGFLIQSI